MTFRRSRKVIPRSHHATRDLRKIHVKVEGAKAPIVILSREAPKDLPEIYVMPFICLGAWQAPG